jgi:D-alanyl-D-alanine carboxypeptidase
LNHTTGIPEYIIKETFGKDIVENPGKVWKPEEHLSYILNKPAVNPAGEGWSYADANYIILGMIIERVCNNTYYNELDKRILKPMKLTRTIPQDSRKVKGVAQGHSGDSPYLVAPATVLNNGEFFVNPQFEWTGGGLFTNPIDLAVWARYLWRGDFLPKDLTEQMKQVVSFETGKPGNTGYGFGVMKFPSQKYGALYTHGGIMFGYLTEVFYLEQYDISFAIQINTDPFSGFFKASLQQIAVRELIPFIVDNLGSK